MYGLTVLPRPLHPLQEDSSTQKKDAPTATKKVWFCYCNTTEKQVHDDDEWLECGGCNGWFHLQCTRLTIEEEEGCHSLKLPGGGQSTIR